MEADNIRGGHFTLTDDKDPQRQWMYYALNVPGWTELAVPMGSTGGELQRWGGLLTMAYNAPKEPTGFVFRRFLAMRSSDPTDIATDYDPSCDVRIGIVGGIRFQTPGQEPVTVHVFEELTD